MQLNGTLLSVTISIVILFLTFDVSAQLVDKGAPISWNGKISPKKKDNVIKMPQFDLQAVLREDAVNDKDKTKPWRFGYNHEVNFGTENSGEWIDLKNGGKIWLLNIYSPGAKTINVIFDQFYIPEGAYLQMYNRDRKHLVGAYTHILNNEAQILGTELVQGDYITLEYYEPAHTKENVKLNIGTVTHGYRSLSLLTEKMMKDLNDSGACNIDVLCPLGNGWNNQIRSVGMIIVNGNSGCSGALINNTAGDGRPFFLTADHCLGNPSNWVFRFNWHSTAPSCASNIPSGDGPYFQSTFTSTLRASSEGSDFALVELNDNIPAEWGVYFAGWDRTDIAPSFTLGIHHPAGDIKKICRDDNAPTKTTDGAAQVWRINEWEHGVTEPGSSGSPLFDPAGRIIGQLFGGLAACISNNSTQNNGEHDVYGRFGISWNGSSASTRLRDWLDPNNTELMILEGYDPALSNAAIDVTLLSAGNPSSPSCTSAIELQPRIRNLGSVTITQMQIEVRNGANLLLEFPWTGSLESGDIITIELPAFDFPAGLNQLTMNVLDPNGLQDENPLNNTLDFNLTVVEDGEETVFTLMTDCFGTEIAWGIADINGNIIAEGGPYEDISGGETIEREICLAEGCYTFVIIDSFGDGLFGSQYNECNVDGNYFMLDAEGNVLFEMTAPNGDFGEEAIHNFCIEGQTLVPSFASSSQNICRGQSVQFEDSSTGDPTSWIWTFPGGSPEMSDNQNPNVTYNFPGTYAVTLQISNGQNTESITITDYITVGDTPEVSISQTGEFSCTNNCTGELLAIVTGGTAPYNYLWSNGATTDIISNLCYAPSFFVIVTDAVGCIADRAIEIEQNDAIILEMELDINCADSSACAQLFINGGEEPYIITWSTGQSDTLSVCELPVGEHSVSVEDANGCSSTFEFTIFPFAPLIITADITHGECSDECSGVIITSVSGTEPFSYNWSNGSESPNEDNLCPGEYRLTVTDGNGCSADTAFLIEGTFIDLNLTLDHIGCNEETGCASINPAGGTAPYIITWSTGQSDTTTICNLEAGVYVVTVADQNGCQRVREFRIEMQSEFNVEFDVIDEKCFNECDGRIVIQGSQSNTYVWSENISNGPAADSLCAGQYSVTVTNEQGCTRVLQFEIEAGDEAPVASFTASSVHVNINVDPRVSFTNESEGADRYEWSFGDGTGSDDENPGHTYTEVGEYLVILYAINGSCIKTDSIVIIVDEMVGTNNIELHSNILLFPNPANDRVSFKLNGNLLASSVEIIHMNGSILQKQVIDTMNNFNVAIDRIPGGVYFVRIQTNAGVAIKKLIIQN